MWWFLVLALHYVVIAENLEIFEPCSIPLLNMSKIECFGRITHFGDNAIIEIYGADTKVCKTGNILPLFPTENMWDRYTRAIIYLFILIYLFLGIAIIADIFMSAIEVITSKKKTYSIIDEDGIRHESSILIWNETVANLTLMALGSSAPEILLAISETVTSLGKPPSKDGLGAATIVGSAAFNLLVISALCVISIPDGEVRRIKGLDVFAVTAFFSVFAYIWVYIVLVAWTPDVVELWEALVTLAMFPLLVLLSYGMDAKPCASVVSVSPLKRGFTFRSTTMNLQKHFIHRFVKGKKDHDPANIAAALTEMAYEDQKKSRLHYRINAVRILKGGKRIIPKLGNMHILKNKPVEPIEEVTPPDPIAYTTISSKEYEVCDEDCFITILIRRAGCMENEAIVEYETGNGTAKATQHYAYTAGIAKFAPGECIVKVRVPINDSTDYHRKSLFFVVRLQNFGKDTLGGAITTARIYIVSHDSSGTFEMERNVIDTHENVGELKIQVVRNGGTSGEARLRWTAGSEHLDFKNREKAISGSDFYPDHGELVFAHGEKRKAISIKIIDDDQCESDEKFEVEVFPAEGWEDQVTIGKNNKCIVTILDDDEVTNMVEKVCGMLDVNMDRLHCSSLTWTQQFVEAMEVMGEEDGNPSNMDYIMHAITFFWKVLFSCIPPTSIWGGWLTFVVSLTFIGVLTVIVGDAASIFGCLVGFPDAVTAITFVALGTSLPDTFASMTAAKQDAYADASIGNITGSNSVNVFLGLGLPWTIAAIYYGHKDEVYVFYGGTLAYSVAVFCVCAISCLIMLVARRHPAIAKGELGGPKTVRYITAVIFVGMWFVYVILSSIKSLEDP